MAKSVKEIEIKVEGKEWEEALDKAFKEANKKAKIDGFRPGHAPKEVFIKKYGEQALYMDAAEAVVDGAYEKMLKENEKDLEDLVARPDVQVKKINGEGVTFNFVLTMRPEVKLGDYKKINVKREKAKVTAEEIEDTIENIRHRYAEDVLKDGEIKDGDVAVIDFDGFVDGVAFEGGKG